jgi:hypothetical protein
VTVLIQYALLNSIKEWVRCRLHEICWLTMFQR